jgi:spermidine/putrescine transport system substrate-binding protein
MPSCATLLNCAFLCATFITMGFSADDKKVMMLSYSEYIDPAIPTAYEAATGVKVQIDVYESQEDMIAKLQAGGSEQYDIVVATDVVVPTLIHLGLVQKLDQKQIPNHVNVMDKFRNPVFDPNNAYSYPYQWGTIGLMYVTEKFPAPLSWASIFDPAKQPGPFILMDEMRSMTGIALLYLGKSANATQADDIKACGQLLAQTKKSAQCLGFDGGVGGMNKVLAGEAIAAVVYNGDAVRNITDNKYTYAVPKEGGILWVDNMLLCSKAPNPKGGHAFMNHILEANIGAQLSNFNRYATPNKAALPMITEADKNNNAIYPTAAQMDTLHFQVDVGPATQIYDQVWTAVKAR